MGWDKLADHFKDSKSVGVYDVDCTKDEGKPVCTKAGVKGYPTIQYFLPFSDTGIAYQGGRTFEDLKKFADTTFIPACVVSTQEGCSAEEKKLLDSYKASDPSKVKADLQKLKDDLKAKTKERVAKEKDSAAAIAVLKAEEKKQGQIIGLTSNYVESLGGGKDEL